jgi:hypothetical protein
MGTRKIIRVFRDEPEGYAPPATPAELEARRHRRKISSLLNSTRWNRWVSQRSADKAKAEAAARNAAKAKAEAASLLRWAIQRELARLRRQLRQEVAHAA